MIDPGELPEPPDDAALNEVEQGCARSTVRYVLGFAFVEDEDEDELVLLVKKKHGPSINLGKLNGVGGKIEDGEDSMSAMVREFSEETGGCTAEWEILGRVTGDSWQIDLYFGELETDVDDVPEMNDVGEPLRFEEVERVLNPEWCTQYAQNVPTMVAQAALGEGHMLLTVDN